MASSADVDRNHRKRPWSSVAVLAAISLAALGALLVTTRRDTALRVVGQEWERIIEVEEFTGKQWIVVREARVAGSSAADDLAWPEITLVRTGECDGCQREGKRRESYVVRLLDPVSERGHACEFPEAQWKRFVPDSRWEAEFDRRTGEPRCESLTPAE